MGADAKPSLFPKDGLAVFEQGGVDLKDVVDVVGDEIGHDQIELAAGGKGDLRPGQQVQHGGHVQLQRDGEGHCRFLFGAVIRLAPDAGEHLPVDIGLFIASSRISVGLKR